LQSIVSLAKAKNSLKKPQTALGLRKMTIGVVIVCAGKGRRLGKQDKATLDLGAKPLFWHSIKAFSSISRFKQIVLVLDKRNFKLARKFINKKNILLVEGGKKRKDSVFNGLSALREDVSHVLIHDGARPFVDKLIIIRLLKELKNHEAVICGIKSQDTLKLVKGGLVKKTLNRENIFCVHTPQAFKKNLILKAYKRFKMTNFTDEAQIIELMGKKVKVLEANSRNFKITYPGDISIARAIISYKL